MHVQVAPGYVPDVTSYDYDAPITESGQVKDRTTLHNVLECLLTLNPDRMKQAFLYKILKRIQSYLLLLLVEMLIFVPW